MKDAGHRVVHLAAVALVFVSGCKRPGADDRSEAPRVTYGAAMADVARRFEVLGRATKGGRYELASYELGEIQETFEGTLPHAAPPREGHPEVLPKLAKAFLDAAVPDLRRALASHDRAAATAAFARTAAECNACHSASGHAFVEVPSVLGRSVPETEPQAPAPATSP
jgi:cytochrome c556